MTDRVCQTWQSTGEELNGEYVRPRNSTEEKLIQIWESLLQTRPIGIQDNFFEFGGHSLLAVRLVSQIENELGVELPIRTVFEKPTISELGENLSAEKLQSKRTPILSEDQEGEHPLSYAQERLWFVEQLGIGGGVYNIPFGVRIQGHLDRDSLSRSLEEVIRRHSVLRTTYTTVEGEPFQRVLPEWIWGLENEDLRGLSEAEQELELSRRMEEEGSRSFIWNMIDVRACLWSDERRARRL